MHCKWLICLDFNLHRSKAHQTAHCGLAGRSMPCRSFSASDECQAPRGRNIPGQTSRRFAIQLRKFHARSRQFCTFGCMRIQVIKSPSTGSVLMTTRLGLIYMCLQRLTSLLVCTNQPIAQVNRAHSAIFLVATTCWTTAPLHPRAYAQTPPG